MHSKLNFIFFLILSFIHLTESVISLANLTKMLYLNEINTWIPEYYIQQKYNKLSKRKEYHIAINATAVYQQILPASLGYNKTKVFAYSGHAKNPLTDQDLGIVASFPAPTISTECAKPLFVNYTNNIKGQHLFNIPKNLVYDPLLTSNLNINNSKVPIITHVHGLITQSTSDGYPGAFVTASGERGPEYNTIRTTVPNSFVFYYPNYPSQQLMFYHDHMIGMTRLNVYAGLVGFYKIQTKNIPTPLNVINQKYDVMIAIADRTFNDDGSLFYPDAWQPEYFGEAITVNGVVWPKMRLENNIYRLRILNGCNSRFLHLTFISQGKKIKFTVVKGDENYLDNSVELDNILIAPAQRYEIIIDLRNYLNKKIEILNDAPGPYPSGDPANFNSETTGKIMRLDVDFKSKSDCSQIKLPISFQRTQLSSLIPVQSRNLILIQDLFVDPSVPGSSTVLASFLGGQDTMVYLKPFIIGQVYQFNFINLTPDTHPIHIHLTNFEIQSIKGINADQYKKDWIALNGPPPIPVGKSQKNLSYKKYLNGTTLPILPIEKGLKDVCLVDPGTVKVARVRFTEFNGDDYTFDASKGYGFAIHCHILQHEDNSMMRLFRLYKSTLTPKFVMNSIMD